MVVIIGKFDSILVMVSRPPTQASMATPELGGVGRPRGIAIWKLRNPFPNPTADT
jgi:hypothetical protein